jgi:PAS domain S-box-containing protein
MVSLDGRTTQVETVGSMIDFQGEPAVQIIIRDITGRKRAEEELRRTHELLEAITKGTEVIIAAVDKDLRYTYFNTAYQDEIKRLTGKDIHTGTSMVELFAHMHEQQRIALDAWGRVLSGESVNKTIEFGDPCRHRRIYNVIQTPLRDAQGIVVGAGEVAYDVTERMQIEKELNISLTKYKVLFNAFPLGISITDKVGNIIESNKEAERLLGISQEEHQNRSITGDQWRIIRPDGSDMPEDEYASVIALKDNCLVENVEMGIMKGEGDITWINVTAAPIPLEGYGVAITYGDVSKRKIAEEALRKSERRFHDLFSSMSEGFALHEIMCDEDGRPCDYRFIDVNPAFEKLTGLKREDVVGRTVLQVLPDEDPKWIEIYGSVALTGEPVHFENYSPVLKRYYEVFSYCPAPKEFAVIFMDITQRKFSEEELCRHRDNLEELVKERTTELEARNKQLIAEVAQRKKAENALRMAGAYNRSLIEAGLDPLVTIDVNGRITDVNMATEKVTGRNRRELVGTDFSDYFTEPEKARTGYQKVFSEGKVQDYPLDILHRDGHITPVLYNASLYYDQEGKVLGVFAAARDITERKRAEEEKDRLESQLIQAQRIEALGKLAGGIAHDFNNVLQPILINSELISDILPHGTQEREYLDQIIDAAHLGKNLIRQIKLFGSRKGSVFKPIAIGPVIQEALKLLKRSIPKGVTFRQWITSSESLVQVDPTQIQQIILNLCNNSVQAMKEGKGFLGVSLKETEIISYTPALVSNLKPGRYLKLTVRDTGSGISAEIRDKLFDPFFTTKKSSKGTGLGLAVVHETVKNASGSILLHSDVGKGTRFEVYLPQYTGPMDQAPKQIRQFAGQGEKHVLLADDNEADLRSIHQLLIHLGFQVTSTTDPQEALHIFMNAPKMFSLIITDQVMPRLRGHELAGHVRQIRKDIPVILCSGSEDIVRELQEKKTPINEYILKPFSRSQLQEAIGRVLS